MIFAIACVVVVFAVRLVCGSFRVFGSLTVVVLAAALTVTSGLRMDAFPIEWISLPDSLPLVAISTVSAGALGLFFRPWWIRAIGGVSAAAAIAFLFIPAIQGSWQANAAAAADERAKATEAQHLIDREAAFDAYIAETQHPAIPDLPGVSLNYISAGAEYTTTSFLLSSGSPLETWVDATGLYETNEASPCWRLMPDQSKGYTMTETLEDYAYFCVRDERGWTRTDGMGAARVIDDKLVVVLAGGADGPGTQPTSPADVEEVISTIRFMDEAEFRLAVRDSFTPTYTSYAN